jgi:hypothetical protein
VKWLYDMGDIDIHSNNEECFRISCEKGYLELAQWLYSLGNVDINILNNYAFTKSCKNGHINVAKWLYSINNNVIMEFNYIFYKSCIYGHLEIATWLYSISNVDFQTIEDIITDGCNCNKKILQWLYFVSIDKFSIELTCFEKCKFFTDSRIHNWLLFLINKID